jgi:DNA-binding IclR family transcriptional regulator
VSELAADVGASKSTVYAHLQTLRGLGYVVTTDDGYALGVKFLNLGDAARRRHPPYRAAKTEMDRLVESVGERGQVMVEEGGRGVYVYQVKADQAVQTDSHVGTTVNLHATAVGKSYLAFAPEAKRAEVLSGGLDAITSNTVTDRAAFEAELATVRERGYAFNDEERTPGMRAVGAPIRTADGEVLGALSVSGPTTRLSGEWYRTEVPEMVTRAARVVGIRATYS